MDPFKIMISSYSTFESTYFLTMLVFIFRFVSLFLCAFDIIENEGLFKLN